MQGHIEDVWLGTNSKEDHYILLQEFFSVYQGHKMRIKLEKRGLLREEMEYLGFDVGYHWCTPAASRTEHLIDAKIIREKSKQGVNNVKGFIGACNFYRRHIRNFIYTRARLTNATKKNTPWVWGLEEQKCFQQLADKVTNAKCLEVARPKGEIILISVASDVGGGWGGNKSMATPHPGRAQESDGKVMYPIGEQGWHPQAQLPIVRVDTSTPPALEIEMELRQGQVHHL